MGHGCDVPDRVTVSAIPTTRGFSQLNAKITFEKAYMATRSLSRKTMTWIADRLILVRSEISTYTYKKVFSIQYDNVQLDCEVDLHR